MTRSARPLLAALAVLLLALPAGAQKAGDPFPFARIGETVEPEERDYFRLFPALPEGGSLTLLWAGTDSLRVVQDGRPDGSDLRISADQAREIVRLASLAPVEGARKVMILHEFHLLRPEGAALLLKTLGAEVTLVAPPTLLPVGVHAWPAQVSYDLDAVLPKSDVVMMLRVQRERMGAAYFPSAREYARRYGLDTRRVTTLKDDAIVMHPGPMVRGMEIAPEVADGVRSTIQEQVANGVSVRMAVLYLLLGGAESAIGAASETREQGTAE